MGSWDCMSTLELYLTYISGYETNVALSWIYFFFHRKQFQHIIAIHSNLFFFLKKINKCRTLLQSFSSGRYILSMLEIFSDDLHIDSFLGSSSFVFLFLRLWAQLISFKSNGKFFGFFPVYLQDLYMNCQRAGLAIFPLLSFHVNICS